MGVATSRTLCTCLCKEAKNTLAFDLENPNGQKEECSWKCCCEWMGAAICILVIIALIVAAF